MRTMPIEMTTVQMEPWKLEAIATGVAKRLETLMLQLGYNPETMLYTVARELKDRTDLTELQEEFRDLHMAAASLEHELARLT